MTGRHGVLLEVVVRHAQDVRPSVEGGADRLRLQLEHGTPDVATASAVLRASTVPVRLSLSTAVPDDLGALVGQARELLRSGAEGLCFGFLDADLEIDVATTAALANALPGVPWTFPEIVDDVLDPRRSWQRLRGLPGLSAVATAGSPQGIAHGYDELLAHVEADPAVARLAMPSGGLVAEQVPWLVRAGVRQIAVAEQVRPGGSSRAYVDAALVRSWRLLLDGLDRVAGLGGTASA